jgi:hypothetical protein
MVFRSPVRVGKRQVAGVDIELQGRDIGRATTFSQLDLRIFLAFPLSVILGNPRTWAEEEGEPVDLDQGRTWISNIPEQAP